MAPLTPFILNDLPGERPRHWITSLREFVGAGKAETEHCELCNEEIGHEHQHLIEPESRRLVCACPACALLFDSSEAKPYRRVPRRVKRLREFALSDAQWDAFLIPINMAFFFYSSPAERVIAMYPGPAGATESTLDLDAWDDLEMANPLLTELEADVEALLVYRVEGARECYRLPIDRCYELVGAIRSNWHGLSGGENVREAIQAFFGALRSETSN